MRNAVKTQDSNADTGKKLDREIDRLASLIQQFRVQGQRFIAGDLKLPPEELRDRIMVELRRLRSANLKGAAVNFRLGTLESQFQSQLDLFGRRLRERELSARHQDEAAGSLPDPMRGVVLGRQADATAVKALYGGLYQHHGQKPNMDLERFHSYIDRQVEAIRAKTGCSEIQFRIAVQDGKMKLKAKPIRDGRG
ncbi:MAG: hypothetical protein GY719_15450 [bacterium]|nr:hypothetical protein [bacterium]